MSQTGGVAPPPITLSQYAPVYHLSSEMSDM